MCPSILPSVRYTSACMRIFVADCLLLYRFVCLFRSSVRPIVRPSLVLSSVRPFECKFLSLNQYACPWHSLSPTPNFLLLTSYFALRCLFSVVYAFVQDCTTVAYMHLNCPSVVYSSLNPAKHSFVFKPIFMNASVCL